jgi:predicted ABC-type transport system involved in lysophospholipase L1 biosynthesis ATPase subunit
VVDVALLELADVSKVYEQGGDRVVALDGVDLSVAEGESVALVGRSGSGKSTLLHLAGGLDRPDRGCVRLAGRDLSAMSVGDRARLRRREVGFIFQFFHLVPGLSVAENVELPLLLDGRRDRDGTVTGLLERVGLGHRARHHPGQLSGGEMQRTAIARALVARPALVLADEPTGNLDSTSGAAILDLLTEVVTDAGAAMVLVTHDESAARRLGRTLHVQDGRLLVGEAQPPPANGSSVRGSRRVLRAAPARS